MHDHTKEQQAREEEETQAKKKYDEEIDVIKTYKEDVVKYEHLKRKKLMKASESKTLDLLNSFRERLFNAKNKFQDDEQDEDSEKKEEKKPEEKQVDKPMSDLDRVLAHKLDVDEEIRKKVIDANIADNDRFDIYDPRNALNKRKRSKHDKEDKEHRHKRH